MPQINFIDFSPKTRFINYAMNNRPFPAITFGAGSYLVNAEYGKITYRNHILIGKFCALAHNLNFNMGWNHNYKNVTSYPFDAPQFEQLKIYTEGNKLPIWEKKAPQHRQIIIGNDVWIGADATIMGGAIIGANSVVAKNIPPYAIAVGNPARVIKYRFDAETIKKFMAVKWWNWDIKKILDNVVKMKDVKNFLTEHYQSGLERVSYAQIFLGGGRLLSNFVLKAGKFLRLWGISAQYSRYGKELLTAF